MRKTCFGVMVLGVWSVVLPGFVKAHHGDAGRYIADVTSVTGTVAQFVMVNPHAFVVLDVAEDGKTTRWTGELNAPENLTKNFGWTPEATKKWVGSRVTVTGRRLKSGAPYINLTDRARIVLADGGQEIYRTANFGAPPPAGEK
jgi:hypothetical protein